MNKDLIDLYDAKVTTTKDHTVLSHLVALAVGIAAGEYGKDGARTIARRAAELYKELLMVGK